MIRKKKTSAEESAQKNGAGQQYQDEKEMGKGLGGMGRSATGRLEVGRNEP